MLTLEEIKSIQIRIDRELKTATNEEQERLFLIEKLIETVLELYAQITPINQPE